MLGLAVKFYFPEEGLPVTYLVDGLWGSGKSLVGSVVSSLKGSEPYRMDPALEWLVAYRASEELTLEAFRAMVLALWVEGFYATGIGRQLNLRPSDDSFALASLGILNLAKRMKSRGGDDNFQDRVKLGQPNIIVSHLLGVNLPLLLEAFPEGFRLISVRRNPVFLALHYQEYLKSFDRVRELTPSVQGKMGKVPFFALSWSDEWSQSSPADRALLSVARCATEEMKALDKAKSDPTTQEKVHITYFSELLTDPQSTVAQLASFVGRDQSAKSRKIARDLNGLALRVPWRKTPHRPDLSPSEEGRILDGLNRTSGQAAFREFEKSLESFKTGENLRRATNPKPEL